MDRSSIRGSPINQTILLPIDPCRAIEKIIVKNKGSQVCFHSEIKAAERLIIILLRKKKNIFFRLQWKWRDTRGILRNTDGDGHFFTYFLGAPWGPPNNGCLYSSSAATPSLFSWNSFASVIPMGGISTVLTHFFRWHILAMEQLNLKVSR